MRLSAIATCLSLCLIGFAAANDARASIRQETSIPPQGLAPALKTLAKERNFQIVYVTEEIANVHTQGAVGEFTPEEVLKKLLTGTGLVYRYLDDKTVTIIPAGSTLPQQKDGTVLSTGEDPNGASSSAKEGKKDSSGEFRVAQANQGSTQGSSTVANETQNSTDNRSSGPALTEIIVTAQKRSERLQDVPVPVTLISADTLLNGNQLRIQDYYTSVPGLTVTPDDARGAPILTIRGITTGGLTNPTVGVTVDDVPYGSSTVLGGGWAAPDIDPSDLAHIEVLRGPQGTLYGASTLGGLLKFVTVDPSTDGYSGRVEAGTSSVYNGNELGYNVRGAVNIPISDTLAVRASGFTREDPGYIENVVSGEKGINRVDAEGGRLSALWRPTELVSLKLSALFQHATANGSNQVDVEPGLGDLQQSVVPGTGGYDRTFQVYSAILTAKLGIADLTALSGYSVNKLTNSYDYTYVFGPYTEYGVPGSGFNGFGVPGTPLVDNNKTDKFTQEIRLSVPFGKSLDWLLGVFYTHESNSWLQQIVAANPTTGQTVGVFANFNFPTTYIEYAAFTDLTIHLTDRFDIQVGGRESQNTQSYSEVDSGPYVPLFEGSATSTLLFPEVVTHESAFTYLVTPEFKFTPDLMAYARLASGFRPGGPNATATVFGLPPAFGPDKTQNYEIGVKGNVLDHRLSFDASLYYINWKDIQLQLTDPANGLEYFANGSRAKSQGVELSAESRPLTGLTISAWVDWDDAVLTEPFPASSTAAGGAYGVSGNRLPYSSRFSGNVSLEQDFPLGSRVTGFVGGAVSYVGDRVGVFTPSAERQDLPAYARTDLRAGAKYDSWTLNLFANNVADKRALLDGGLGTAIPITFNPIQPRTIGLSVARSF